MKVASFLPAITQMIYDMGLQHMLDGITFECPKVALNEKQRVVRCVMEGKNYTSDEINTLFSNSKKTGESLYYVDEPVLSSIAPDIIFTQDVCEVCQIDTKCTAAAVANLEKQPELIPINPASLQDVFDSVLTIAKALRQEEVGKKHLENLEERVAKVLDVQRKNRLLQKSVMLLEWIDPLFNCGHWIPHQIGCAGGVDLLAHPSGDSIVIEWEKIVKYDPEVLIIAPCGYTTETTLKDMPFLTNRVEWQQLRAVKNKAVYIADFDMFTQPSASTLVNGIEVLAKIIHPAYFTVESNLQSKFSNYFDLLVQE
ncbi:ABC transporter substrate-binding protein [Flavicella marina]|uniref:ABC transporter substrate-binding protein n=1 Tax=Flavicella marina TaxID=1475951 RepID=UPI0012655F56|nr:ABC transporter substrate-binding protein [Flavicella marina]